MEEKEIIICGQKFVAERLIPNYQGKYECTCSECIFNSLHRELGCKKVKCIHSHFDEGNRNVWVPVIEAYDFDGYVARNIV